LILPEWWASPEG